MRKLWNCYFESFSLFRSTFSQPFSWKMLSVLEKVLPRSSGPFVFIQIYATDINGLKMQITRGGLCCSDDIRQLALTSLRTIMITSQGLGDIYWACAELLMASISMEYSFENFRTISKTSLVVCMAYVMRIDSQDKKLLARNYFMNKMKLTRNTVCIWEDNLNIHASLHPSCYWKA